MRETKRLDPLRTASPEWIDRIESLVHQAEQIQDSKARTIAIELSQAIMQFHQAALNRALEIISYSNCGVEVLTRMAHDDLTSSLLLAHDLHPETTEIRVERAIARLDEAFRSLGARVSLAGMSSGVVCVNFESSRSWPSQTRANIEKFVFQTAPEIEALVIEGVNEEPPRDFIPVSGILAGSRP
jgi:hypothetical protein